MRHANWGYDCGAQDSNIHFAVQVGARGERAISLCRVRFLKSIRISSSGTMAIMKGGAARTFARSDRIGISFATVAPEAKVPRRSRSAPIDLLLVFEPWMARSRSSHTVNSGACLPPDGSDCQSSKGLISYLVRRRSASSATIPTIRTCRSLRCGTLSHMTCWNCRHNKTLCLEFDRRSS
jgi:hypothetical protein